MTYEPQKLFGEYRVTGARAYRGHAPGETFIARLDRLAEGRAIRRGAIELLERLEPMLRSGSYTLPDDWEQPQTAAEHGAARLTTLGG